jgi:hypothetical protein
VLLHFLDDSLEIGVFFFVDLIFLSDLVVDAFHDDGLLGIVLDSFLHLALQFLSALFLFKVQELELAHSFLIFLLQSTH